MSPKFSTFLEELYIYKKCLYNSHIVLALTQKGHDMSVVDDWTTLLAERNDLVGGDLELQICGLVYRGPIQSISVDADRGRLTVYMDWLAVLDRRQGREWKAEYSTPYGMKFSLGRGIISPPQHIGEGRIVFATTTGYLGVIFPAGGSKLSPEQVAGLKV